MRQTYSPLHGTLPLVLLVSALGLLATAAVLRSPEPAPKATAGPGSPPRRSNLPIKPSDQPYKLERLRGKVVWTEEAMLRHFDLQMHLAARKSSVVLETAEGQVIPLMPDVRGQAFVIDERLRDIEVEMNVLHYAASPMVQVVTLYRRKDDGLYEVDYWCDVCAISMFELKDCECCQGDIRLREERVEE